jgi:hypothetical protein
METSCGGSSMSENKNAKTPADGPTANRAMTLEEAQQWITTTWLRCQDEVWRQLPTPKKVSKDDVTPPKREWVPEALRLADALDDEFVQGRISNHNGRKAAAELRRLHEVNQDLLKALNTILNISLIDNGHWAKTIEREAHEAIAKATGGEV